MPLSYNVVSPRQHYNYAVTALCEQCSDCSGGIEVVVAAGASIEAGRQAA